MYGGPKWTNIHVICCATFYCEYISRCFLRIPSNLSCFLAIAIFFIVLIATKMCMFSWTTVKNKFDAYTENLEFNTSEYFF